MDRPRRNALGVILALMAIAAALAWTVGSDWFDATFPPATGYRHAARPALVVAALSFVAFLVALVNATLATADRPTLDISIEHRWDAYLSAGVAIAVGILIGTTIFR